MTNIHFGKPKIIDFIRKYEVITGESVIKSNSRPTNKKKLVISNEELYDMHQRGETYGQLADKYHVSETLIRNRIRNYKESIRADESTKLVNKDKKLKLATLNSVKRILYKYDYTYEELCKVAIEAGYIVRKEDYYEALKSLGKNDEGRDE